VKHRVLQSLALAAALIATAAGCASTAASSRTTAPDVAFDSSAGGNAGYCVTINRSPQCFSSQQTCEARREQAHEVAAFVQGDCGVN
jgi:hypothetical protein